MEAVIFDMDGLMFDTERLWMKAFDYAGEQLGIGRDSSTMYSTIGVNGAQFKQIMLETFGEDFDFDAFTKICDKFCRDYCKQNGVPVKKGLYSLLEYLRQSGRGIALASSTSREKVERHIRSADVEDYFDAVICGDMVEISKPEPEIFLKAAQALGQRPRDCYVLEDSRNGIIAAHRAGCRAIMVPDLWQPDEEILSMLHAKFDDLEQVENYFREIWR